MKFLSVELKNFRAISSAMIALADRGLVAIRGDNQDDSSATSNGAGKSSIGEAICWCCYSVTPNGAGGDEVVRRHSKGGTSVVLTVEDNGHTYVIERYRKHSIYKNQLRLLERADDGTITDMTLGTNALTQIEVEKILGCSFDVFAASIYAAQEAMPDLPGMTDKNLKILIEEASGSNILQGAYEDARLRLKLANDALNEHRSIIERVLETIVHKENMADSYIKALTSWNLAKNEEIDENKRLIEITAEQVADLAKDISGLPTKKELHEKSRLLNDKILVNAETEKDLRAIDSKILQNNTECARAEYAWKMLLAERKANAKSIAEADGQIGQDCPHCGRPITEDEIAETKSSLLERKSKIDKAITEARAKLDSALESAEKLTDERLQKERDLVDVSAIFAEKTSIERELAELTNYLNNFEDLKIKLKNAEKRRDELLKLRSPLEESLEQVTKSIDELGSKLNELKKEEVTLSNNVNIADSVVKVFSPAGVRAYILDDVTPFLNDRTAKYLSVLTDGAITAEWSTLTKSAKGELKENFSITVNHKHGAGSFKSISGGEKRRVRIACALALQDLIARRAVKPIELFFGDEIDDALDDAGLERLTQVLQDKAKERGSVFIISHNPGIKDWIDQTITVTKHNGGSLIKDEST